MSQSDKSAERTFDRKNRKNGKIGNTGNRGNHRKSQQQKRLILFNKLVGLHVNCLLFTARIKPKLERLHHIYQQSPISKFMKICRMGTNLFQADRQTDRHDEAKSCYLLCEAPQIEFPRIRSKLNSQNVCYQ
jgi:hypothetical protein